MCGVSTDLTFQSCCTGSQCRLKVSDGQSFDCGGMNCDSANIAALAYCKDPGGMMMGGQCPHAVLCTDQSIQQLSLFKPANNGATVSDTMAGGVFTSSIDATAGGLTPTRAYVYAKFTDTGLAKVAIGDEDALASSDWDIAFRRFVIRLNSGVSGPSCVTVARAASGTTFDALTAVPGGLDYRTEEYFTPTCDYVPDGSGMMSPGVAMQSFWEYPGCVKMTKNVFVIKLTDGRQLKLQVMQYYDTANQASCDNASTITMGNNGAANYKIKWAFLP
jgi:hypothetical protein